MSSEYVQVTTAAETKEAATTLAGSAVRAHLAASAQVVGPVTSVYWHLGEYGESDEYMIVLKTTFEGYPALEEHLIKNHPWENAEIVAVPFVAGAPNYLAWIRETVAESAEQ